MMLITSQSALRAASSPDRGASVEALIQTSPVRGGGPPQAVERFREAGPSVTPEEVLSLRNEVRELRTLILSQNGLLEQLVRQQARIRVSRSQERALREAVRMRAEELEEDLFRQPCGLPPSVCGTLQKLRLTRQARFLQTTAHTAPSLYLPQAALRLAAPEGKVLRSKKAPAGLGRC